MPEEILESSERNEILRQVFGPKPVHKEKQLERESLSTPSSPSPATKKLKTFGSLLEESIAIRESIDKEENKEADEVRKQVIKESRTDLVSEMMKGFFK